MISKIILRSDFLPITLILVIKCVVCTNKDIIKCEYTVRLIFSQPYPDPDFFYQLKKRNIVRIHIGKSNTSCLPNTYVPKIDFVNAKCNDYIRVVVCPPM